MIKHIDNKIQNAIQLELFKAKESIKIAVAWFTNELLLQPLVLKLQGGVSVELIINDDEINRNGESSLDFSGFLNAGGILRWNDSKQLLHEKFCIIDNRIVITGSYNWTNKAEYNSEVETFYYDEEETTHFFNEKFGKLAARFEKESFTRIIHNGNQNKINDDEKSVQSDEDEYYYDELGAKYSKDKTILIEGVNVKAYTIQNETKIIKENAFRDASFLENIDLANVEIIENCAFQDCISLKKVCVPSSTRKIGSCVFMGCQTLEKVILPPLLSTIEDSMFAYCDSLKSVKLPLQIHRIADMAFYFCESLNEINFPDHIQSIGRNAFNNCKGLTHVSFPQSLKYIGDQAFKDCLSLKEIIIGDLSSLTDGQKEMSLIFGGERNPRKVIIKGGMYVPPYKFSGCDWLEEIILSPDLSEIGECAFAECTLLDHIILPPHTRNISSSAFSKCSALKSISFPKSVRIIDEYAFSSCSMLNSIDFNEGLTTIGRGGFRGCKELKEICIPKTVSNIGDKAFSECDKICKIVVCEGNKKYDSRNNCNAIIETKQNKVLKGCEKSVLDKSIINIDDYAFQNCFFNNFNIQHIIPSSITHIGKYAFEHSTWFDQGKYASINIPSSVKIIEEYAFSNSSAKGFLIPQSVKKIGAAAFSHCSSLENVVLNADIKCLSDKMFQECGSLKKVSFSDSIKVIGYKAFSRCLSLNDVVFPNHLLEIQSCAFEDCWDIEKLKFPISLSQIGERAFEGCMKLEQIVLPPSLRKVGERVFSSCLSLKQISVPTALIEGDNLIKLPPQLTQIGSNNFNLGGFNTNLKEIRISELQSLLCYGGLLMPKIVEY